MGASKNGLRLDLKHSVQRYLCKSCNHRFTLQRSVNYSASSKWFSSWLIHGTTIPEIQLYSHWGRIKVERYIKRLLTATPPPLISSTEVLQSKHLVIDATYFHRTRGFLVVCDDHTGLILQHQHIKGENKPTLTKFCNKLYATGITPVSITLDGNSSTIRYLREQFPDMIQQRCLTHITIQCVNWLRKNPKTLLAKQLKTIAKLLSYVETYPQKYQWIQLYEDWTSYFHTQLTELNPNDKIEGDIIRAYKLIYHALPDMFHYLEHPNIPNTTNRLEGYFSLFWKRYGDHNGVPKNHREPYVENYLTYKNQQTREELKRQNIKQVLKTSQKKSQNQKETEKVRNTKKLRIQQK